MYLYSEEEMQERLEQIKKNEVRNIKLIKDYMLEKGIEPAVEVGYSYVLDGFVMYAKIDTPSDDFLSDIGSTNLLSVVENEDGILTVEEEESAEKYLRPIRQIRELKSQHEQKKVAVG